MAAQFEFRLIDAIAPAGQLEADDLIAIAQSLKEVATKLSRGETEAELVGRPAKRTKAIANLSIGLAPGSTRVLVRRVAMGKDALDFDLDEERSFDEKFEALVVSIAADKRPDWVPSSLAMAAGKLRSALEGAAAAVDFSVNGQQRRRFSTSATRKETWQPADIEASQVTFTGRLRAVNLDTHRLQVTDDTGRRVALVEVEDDAQAGHLLNQYVTVVGYPERDGKGRLSQIHDPRIEAVSALPAEVGVRDPVPLAEILASASGPAFGGIGDFTDAEVRSFFEAIGR